TFQKPFPCPECQRLDLTEHIIDGPSAWSGHVETYHGKVNAPNLPPTYNIWYSGPAPGSQARCLICSKTFRPGQGFARHLQKHKKEGVFAQPFQCAECDQHDNEMIDGYLAWVDHSVQFHGGCSRSGAIIPATCEGTATTSTLLLGNRQSTLKRAWED
ncbi:putative C2H2-type domain-containing protein, partial [Seiridium cardinale]